MGVLQFILITICMVVTVSSARLGNSILERTTQIISDRVEEPNKPPCNPETVGKSIFNDNPSKLWICRGVKDPFEVACPYGQGFNGVGCVPWSEYPCTSDKEPTCEGSAVTRPHQHEDPTKFWVCQNGSPVAYPCPDGSGFMDSEGDIGCVAWSRWRCLA